MNIDAMVSCIPVQNNSGLYIKGIKNMIGDQTVGNMGRVCRLEIQKKAEYECF